MLLMGDEYGRSQVGNNNTWCQDPGGEGVRPRPRGRTAAEHDAATRDDWHAAVCNARCDTVQLLHSYCPTLQ